MKKIVVFCGICVMAGLGSSANTCAQDFKKFDGQYAIASKTMIDPPPGEKKDRVLIFIEGRGARDIYEGIPGPGKKSVCSKDLLAKFAGDLECTKDLNTGDYACAVGLLLRTGGTVRGQTC